MKGVLISVEVDATTVAVGDQIMIGGQCHTVQDMIATGPGRKRLLFTTGETFTMQRTTILWAARRTDPRLRNRLR
ncbi:hypothetical protein [Streptomyces marincola]|uniref:hypothetical protein n=1 Tax=Streptomyces marincola TaxID=2878388 RepID=UPI001CF55454|nr:hypothetical protein [Streptomyces marincola]UCM87912.1 hypothetical protein LC193_08050 [Streptomyces marincola]